jgi:membrane protein YdbS with pleckstrin-like domain
VNPEPVPERIRRLERPHAALWKYYLLVSIATGPGIIVSLPMMFFRYHTLRYRLDEEGIHMKVGILFRREVNLTYARIQDIHLHSNFVQRWLGLANVQVQTASGSAGPELVIEGFKEYEEIRDFLYTRMRGYQSPARSRGVSPSSGAAFPQPPSASSDAEAVSLLLEIRDELRRTRQALESGPGGPIPPLPPVTTV